MATRGGQKFRVPDKNPTGKDINDALTRFSNDTFRKTITKANLPTDGSLAWAVCSDETGGQTLVYWNGSTWRRTIDGAEVS